MDDSIGCAIWFAARAVGCVTLTAKTSDDGDRSGNDSASTTPALSRSQARIVLVGMGADEQLAGYGRHRTKYRNFGWSGLIAELEMDIDRISSRNLGRDDRCISCHGREARFPFLDEEVVCFLNTLRIDLKVNFLLPQGEGEKKLLRDCARAIGLGASAGLAKRAIQFGSRIAKIDGKCKGSDKF